MKILNGTDLAGYIKERQAKQVRSMRQSQNINPRLAIIKNMDDPVIATYVNLKKRYGNDIGVEVEIHEPSDGEIVAAIETLNKGDLIHGIIVQLPISESVRLDEVLNSVSPEKDVDGLAQNSVFEPATPKAINWLLNGYNIDLVGNKIALIGRGRLVGAPLERFYKDLGYDIVTYEKGVQDLDSKTRNADIVITATGVPGLIKSSMLAQGAVAIDAGVASEDGKTVGDFADDVYSRDDLTLTPKKGGVGPLTVCALFENVITAAQKTSKL